MACLRASLSPASRAAYKYSLGLSADLAKPHLVINALREYYGAAIGVSGERQKFLRLLQNEDESTGSWETRIRNQAYSANMRISLTSLCETGLSPA